MEEGPALGKLGLQASLGTPQFCDLRKLFSFSEPVSSAE